VTVALETVGLQKRFGGLVATDDVTFQLRQGARHALIGPNGAGKTTFINLLTGVLPPSAGRILLEGADITRLSPEARVRRGLSRTFQINQLFPAMTPLETLGLAVSERLGGGRDWWRVFGANRAIADEVSEIAGRFRLQDVLDERTADLPYGKQRLLEIAVAFAGGALIALTLGGSVWLLVGARAGDAHLSPREGPLPWAGAEPAIAALAALAIVVLLGRELLRDRSLGS